MKSLKRAIKTAIKQLFPMKRALKRAQGNVLEVQIPKPISSSLKWHETKEVTVIPWVFDNGTNIVILKGEKKISPKEFITRWNQNLYMNDPAKRAYATQLMLNPLDQIVAQDHFFFHDINNIFNKKDNMNKRKRALKAIGVKAVKIQTDTEGNITSFQLENSSKEAQNILKKSKNVGDKPFTAHPKCVPLDQHKQRQDVISEVKKKLALSDKEKLKMFNQEYKNLLKNLQKA